MKLGTRIFYCYILIFAACFYYPINWMLDNLRTRYLEGVEDPLVDQANILASIAGLELESGRFDPEKYKNAFDHVSARQVNARIYQFDKKRVDMGIYITDASGRIIFDSENENNVGADYTGWRDVHRTLNGKYGARSSLKDIRDPESSVLYVAAPIIMEDRIAGVLTVAKPTTNINNFLKSAKPKLYNIGSVALLVSILLSLVVSFWLTRPIKRLTRYAYDVGMGRRVKFPKLDKSEIGEMGKAFQKMQEALEGKKYVEKYVQNLTHEIKSPLSAIRGASELLREKMDEDRRERFLANIHNEANRIQQIVDRMLELAALENRKELRKTENISFGSLINTAIESKEPMLSQKSLRAVVRAEKELSVTGDMFLLHQAVSNLIQNAIDFSPEGDRIEISASAERKMLVFVAEDNGPGIPDYASDKIFDKFFSLQRPDSGKKSTGLGLNFVKEVAALHGGKLVVRNRREKGVRAELSIPLSASPRQ